MNSERRGFIGYGLVLLLDGIQQVIKFVAWWLNYALWIAHCDYGRRDRRDRRTMSVGGGGDKSIAIIISQRRVVEKEKKETDRGGRDVKKIKKF